MSEIFTWQYVQDHWLAILIGVIIIMVITWRWHAAGKEAEKGPVSYALVKHRPILFMIGIITFILLILFISYGGPYLTRFTFWGFEKLVNNTEAVVIQEKDIPEVSSSDDATPTAGAQNQNFALPTPTAAAANPASTTGFTSTMCVTNAATVRSQPNSTADGPNGLGTIPAGTTITMNAVIDSNCVANAQGVNVCQRGQLADQVGSFPAGSWVHLAVLDTNACP